MMSQTKTRMLTLVLLSARVGAFAAGCSVSGNDDADKAGGSDAPTVLRLAVADDADQPDAPYARYFARKVAALSDGSLERRIEGTPVQPVFRRTGGFDTKPRARS